MKKARLEEQIVYVGSMTTTKTSTKESEDLYRLERGLQSMKLATRKTVADALGVKVVELLKGY